MFQKTKNFGSNVLVGLNLNMMFGLLPMPVELRQRDIRVRVGSGKKKRNEIPKKI